MSLAESFNDELLGLLLFLFLESLDCRMRDVDASRGYRPVELEFNFNPSIGFRSRETLDSLSADSGASGIIKNLLVGVLAFSNIIGIVCVLVGLLNFPFL